MAAKSINTLQLRELGLCPLTSADTRLCGELPRWAEGLGEPLSDRALPGTGERPLWVCQAAPAPTVGVEGECVSVG